MAERRPRLVVLLDAAQPGRVKPRLAQGVGPVAAAWWYRHRVAEVLRRLGRDPRWETFAAIPDRGVLALPGAVGMPALLQGPGDPGARLARLFRMLPPGPAIVIGADAPGIRPAQVAEAFAMLGRHEVVFGPTPSGGFWLAGLARGGRPMPADLFHGVRWGSSHALADSLAGLAGFRIGFAAPLAVVETASDLAALRADPLALPFPAGR